MLISYEVQMYDFFITLSYLTQDKMKVAQTLSFPLGNSMLWLSRKF